MMMNDIRIGYSTYAFLIKPKPAWIWVESYADHPQFHNLLRNFLYTKETFPNFTSEAFYAVLSEPGIDLKFKDYLLDNTKSYDYILSQQNSTTTTKILDEFIDPESKLFPDDLNKIKLSKSKPEISVEASTSDAPQVSRSDTLKSSNNVHDHCKVAYYGKVPVTSISVEVRPQGTTLSEVKTSKANSFDVVLYAPPSSGKSTFKQRNYTFRVPYSNVTLKSGNFSDTDDVFQWTAGRKPLLITNMPNLLRYGKFSIAVVPTKGTFISRCQNRGLLVQDEWYSDVLENVKGADLIIYSDAWMGDLFPPIDLE